jgi:hypothetical protein
MSFPTTILRLCHDLSFAVQVNPIHLFMDIYKQFDTYSHNSAPISKSSSREIGIFWNETTSDSFSSPLSLSARVFSLMAARRSDAIAALRLTTKQKKKSKREGDPKNG